MALFPKISDIKSQVDVYFGQLMDVLNQMLAQLKEINSKLGPKT